MTTYLNSLYAFIRHVPSGEVYAAVYESEDSDTIVALSDALHYTDYQERDPAETDVSTVDVTWANAQAWQPL